MSDTIPSSAGWRHHSGIVGRSRRAAAPLLTEYALDRAKPPSHYSFGDVEAGMHDPHPGIFARSVADGRGLATELRLLEPRNAGKPRPGILRLQVSDRDPIARPQALA